MSAAAVRPVSIPGGIAWMLVAVGLFTVMDAAVKWLTDDYSVFQIVFFRSLFAFPPLLFWLWRAHGFGRLRTRRPGTHLLRALIGCTSMVLFFAGYGMMPLAEAIAIGFVAPLFMTALSVPLLGEKVGIRRWTAVLIGFAGVMIMVRPGSGVFAWGSLVLIGGAFTYAIVIVVIRKLSETEPTGTIVFYFTLFTTTASALTLPFVWVTPDAADLALLISVGLIGGVAQLAMTQAFSLAPLAVVAPFEYTAMLWATLVGFVIWGDLPDLWAIVGALVLVGSGLYILHRESVLLRQRQPD
ncbi:DMT family transporter [Zavarzinia sp. CC-PAN008]|uniref:DMT family transporter n=1 Tax=Zavarzinia sp. CC-PAN008 TaxID=3243332 RepID=UPI003F7471C6